MKALKPASRILISLSALAMLTAYFVPLWQILMWAPQYPEGLEMKIWIDNLTGSVKIISALNHYIGMRPIDVSMFPEFSYMKYIVGGLICAGLLTAIINKRFALIGYLSLILACGLAALIDFYMWGYDYGHNLDPTAPIVVPGMSYQPPLIGTKQLLNFTAFSGPDIGGWIFIGAGLLVAAISFFELRPSKNRVAMRALLLPLVLLAACQPRPTPLQYGVDACHSCKMTLVDKKFGAEVVTKKGKVYVFDDANCMINFLNSDQLEGEDVAFKLIVDFAQPENLIPVEHTFFLKSDKIRTPMNSGVAAFETEKTMKEHKAKWNAIYLGWGEVQTEFK
jgi:copper chaperone NosL